MRHLRVAVPVPALAPLTYSLPESLPDPAVGARVLVPVGNRVMTGCVLDVSSGALSTADPGPASIKPILDLLDDRAFLPPDVVALASWVAEYYACGAGDALAAAMPPRAWVESERHARITDHGRSCVELEDGHRRTMLDALASGKPVRTATLLKAGRGAHAALLALERDGLIAIAKPLKGKADASRTIRVAHLTAQGAEAAAWETEPDHGPRLGVRQREALALIRGAPEGIDTAQLAQRGIGAQTLTRLAALGLVSLIRRRIERDPYDLQSIIVAEAASISLTAEQSAALTRLTALGSAGAFRAVLLHGVTGSGKTELYLRLARHTRERSRGVILLVPEIALTPAVAARFRQAFGERVAIQHSGLSDGERHDQWHRIRRGDVDVVVGTRSAVFAPVRALGLIVVDEEHDGSYKQEETPRYNGRDVAVMRARQADALVVLGSATPSLETYSNAERARYDLVRLARRVLDRPMADVQIVDMREEYAAAGPDVILSRALSEAVARRLAEREQAIILLNRRGFATSVICRECGATLDCPNCSLSLTVHRAVHRARCHYCNHSIALPQKCFACGGQFLEQVGFGTERVEADVEVLFPEARVARVDRDTIRRRGAITSVLSRFAAGEIDILVGTQMLAKGHDFPRVTLVGVISADVGLGLADFRAAERTFQLLTQVAGRAGRGTIRGEAIVQTLFPHHYSIRHACRQDYAAFYEEEIAFRRAMRYPPTLAMINAVVKGRTFAAAMHDAADLVRAVRAASSAFRVLGPAPAPLSRLKGEHRAQFFIKGSQRSVMRGALLAALNARPDIARRTIVDVDPMSVL